jgi:hypothetical protein
LALGDVSRRGPPDFEEFARWLVCSFESFITVFLGAETRMADSLAVIRGPTRKPDAFRY